MASALREPITGVWGQSPQRGPGAEPLVRGSGVQSPPEAEKLSLFRCLKEGEIWPIVKDFWVVLKWVKQSVSSQ